MNCEGQEPRQEGGEVVRVVNMVLYVSLQTQSEISQTLVKHLVHNADWLLDVDLKQIKRFSLVRKEGIMAWNGHCCRMPLLHPHLFNKVLESDLFCVKDSLSGSDWK